MPSMDRFAERLLLVSLLGLTLWELVLAPLIDKRSHPSFAGCTVVGEIFLGQRW